LRTLIVVRRNAAAARTIEAPFVTSVIRRSSSSFVQGWFLESTILKPEILTFGCAIIQRECKIRRRIGHFEEDDLPARLAPE
jgi:hypothetical protein